MAKALKTDLERRVAELEAALKAADARIMASSFSSKYVAFPLDRDQEDRLKDHFRDQDAVYDAPFNSDLVGQVGPDNESTWDLLLDEPVVPGLDGVVLRVDFNDHDGCYLARVFGAKKIG